MEREEAWERLGNLVGGSEWVVPGAWVARRGNNTGTRGSGKLGTKGSRKLVPHSPPSEANDEPGEE